MAVLLNNSLGSCRISVTTLDKSVDDLLEHEWLLTNSRGGFGCGTIAGCNTRRYHGLLVGSTHPPANRTVGLSNCLEIIIVNNTEVELSSFEFDGQISPSGFRYITGFHRDVGVHFDYDFGVMELTKSIYLLPDDDAVAIVYDFFEVCQEFDFLVRPFSALRDFHSLQKSDSPLHSQCRGDGVVVSEFGNENFELFLRTEQMWFEHNRQWWYNFLYRKEKQRGADFFEDLWSPGVFKCHVDSAMRIVLWASLGEVGKAHEAVEVDLEVVVDSLALREKELRQGVNVNDTRAKTLYSAAGQFVTERQIEGKAACTILAGYPWFLDWGRDTFISLPGLLLCTGRLAEAGSVLTTFAEAVDDGMIPNRFDDYGGQPHYNSIDASLWFVHAAFEYLHTCPDKQPFAMKLLPAVRWIMDSYRNGTRFGICGDRDGLIRGGDEQTQLTWMDVKVDGVSVTPRYGKAVEINALWYSNLCRMARFYRGRNDDEEKFHKILAAKVGESFCELFWNEQAGYLNDCIFPDGTVDTSLRPNQIYAVSLPYSPLSPQQQRRVVETVERELLTPYGLRTLSGSDERYVGRYQGDPQQRDTAYHQGTVWPYLMGAFVEAFLRVNNFDKKSKKKAAGFLEPLLIHLTQEGCVGSIAEIFDGDDPQRPKGCFAQAWSVAEVLRAYKLVKS